MKDRSFQAVAFCFVALSYLTVSCNSEPAPNRDNKDAKIEEDRSLIVGEQIGNVENGSAFDKAVVEIGEYNKIVLPEKATIRQDGDAGKLQIFMKKTLSFYGHPPEAMSIRQARKNMGCAVQRERDALVIATFGEWDSHIEGGAHMTVLIIVPDNIEIEKRAKLSGEHSVGREWNGKWLTKPKDVKEGYWYGPASPADGWQAVSAVADQDRRAQ